MARRHFSFVQGLVNTETRSYPPFFHRYLIFPGTIDYTPQVRDGVHLSMGFLIEETLLLDRTSVSRTKCYLAAIQKLSCAIFFFQSPSHSEDKEEKRDQI